MIGGFVWSSYFSLLTSFAPSYGWFVFLRSMVGCGVAGTSQGYEERIAVQESQLLLSDIKMLV